jgi:L-rhamnose isomerase/sugar isomerase
VISSEKRIESLVQSAIEIARARAQAQLVDAEALAAAQEANDALTAHRLLKAGFLTDVSPLIAEARLRAGGARAAGVAAGSAGIV